MTLARNPVLIAIEFLAGSVWIGGIVCLTVVARVARATLEERTRVPFFRVLGRRYGIVGNGALCIAIGIGFAMTWPPSSWSGLGDWTVAIIGALVIVTAIGVRQAKEMGRRRRLAIEIPDDAALVAKVRSGTQLAMALRGLMSLLTLVIVVLVASIIGR